MPKFKHTIRKKTWLRHLPLLTAILGIVISLLLLPTVIRIRLKARIPYSAAIVKTNKGDFTLTFRTEAPKTVTNFIKLTESGFYTGTRIHRVVNNLLIQGGDPFSRDLDKTELWGKGGPGYTFIDEIESNDVMKADSVAMVNNGPDSNGSQFFILVAEAPWFLNKHTIFANVSSGLSVVQTISELPSGPTGIPSEEVVIKTITLVP